MPPRTSVTLPFSPESLHSLSMRFSRGDREISFFLWAWSIWQGLLPPRLAHQNPPLVLRALLLSSEPGGIDELDLQQALGLKQPTLSRLTHRMQKAGWIRVTMSPANRRYHVSRTTKAGRAVLDTLRSELVDAPARSRLPRLPRFRRHPTPQIGQLYFDLNPKPKPGSAASKPPPQNSQTVPSVQKQEGV